MKKRVALITGSNRGIGFAICKELAKHDFKVVLTSRNEEKGLQAAHTIDGDIIYHRLDVTNEKSIQEVKTFLENKIGRLDVLINNAGIFIDSREEGENSAFDADLLTLKKTMETNVYGPFRLCQTLIPLMRKNNYGRIVNISSGMGQLSKMGAGYPGYRISKAALNAVTRIFSYETQGENILVNSVTPGLTRTDMALQGGRERNDAREPEEVAVEIVWLAMLPNDGPTGGFFKDKKLIVW